MTIMGSIVRNGVGNQYGTSPEGLTGHVKECRSCSKDIVKKLKYLIGDWLVQVCDLHRGKLAKGDFVM